MTALSNFQLVVKLILISNSEGTRVPSSMLIVGCNMAFGLAFDHKFALGAASGQNMASCPAFSHNFASGMASGQNLAFGCNELFKLITAFGHSKLIKLIVRVGHTNSLVNSIEHIGPKIQTQLIVKLSSDTNFDGDDLSL